MALPSLKALAFDAYGTLLDVRSVAGACEEAFPGRGAALVELWRAKQLEYTWLLSLMERWEDFWQVTERALAYACKALGLPLDPEARRRLMAAYLHLSPFPEVADALEALSGYRLVVLSNGTRAMLEEAFRHAGLRDRFADLLTVEAVRVYKPSPRVYRLAWESLGLAREEVGFVSSNPFDVMGARAAGLWTCWVNRRGAPMDELGVEPDLTVPTLDSLAGALAGG